MKDEETFRTYQMEIGKREAKQKVKDEATIKQYLADSKIEAQADTSGIHYVIHNNAGGRNHPESCVTVKYSGKFMKDGMEFDKNDKIPPGYRPVIPGWRISIPMIGVGDSATFYIPSGLAYGPKGYPKHPSRCDPHLQGQLLGVGAGYDQATQSCK